MLGQVCMRKWSLSYQLKGCIYFRDNIPTANFLNLNTHIKRTITVTNGIITKQENILSDLSFVKKEIKLKWYMFINWKTFNISNTCITWKYQ